MNKHERMMDQIQQHGRRLQAIYPQTASGCPLDLCRALRRLEVKAVRLTLAACNGDMTQEVADLAMAPILAKLRALLGSGPVVVVNWDPRGYALKIDSSNMAGIDLYRDLGGGGILAPEFDGN